MCFSWYGMSVRRCEVSSNQQIRASKRRFIVGWLDGRQIRSPRETSTSSSSRSVTAIGGKAWSTGPSGVSIEAIFEVLRDGITITSSPCAEDAADDRAGEAAVVAVLGRLRADHVLDREAVVDQVAVGGDVDVLEVAEQRLPVEPGHVRPSGSTTLSPASAEIGTKLRSLMSSLAAKVVNSSRISS